ncbi:MAG: hypothetical protein IV090_25725 [Candidatus Sericytochromatia bacterium]|nr:hypothetical protein [Candidatus Sericytochromatia bacterium]
MDPFSFIPLSAGIMRGPFYLVLWVLELWVLALLTGCHVTESLLLAGLPDAPSNALLVVDGQGPEARFGYITKLEIDSRGNLYVLDDGPERLAGNLQRFLTSSSIRQITPEGKVTTLLGRGTTQTLVGTSGMAIRNDVLYVTSAGCLLKADLKKEQPLSFNPFYGKCLSLEQVQNIQKKESQAPDLSLNKNDFWNPVIEQIMPENNLFIRFSTITDERGFFFRVDPDERGFFFRVDPDEKVILEKERRYFPAEGLFGNFVMDSRGMIYGTTLAMPGPGGGGPSKSYKVSYQDLSKEGPIVFQQIPYINQSESLGVFAVDNEDFLYVLNKDGLIQRFSPQGEMVVIGKRDGLQGPKEGVIAGYKVNHQRTWLYFATLTAVYKIPLPPPLSPKGENHETK